MIAAPPLAPAVKLMLADEFAEVAVKLVGALGVVIGVTVMVFETRPSNAPETASNLIEYVVPLVRPEIVIGLVVAAGESAVKAPSFRLYL